MRAAPRGGRSAGDVAHGRRRRAHEGLARNPRGGGQALRAISGRVLAGARPGADVPDRIRAGAHRHRIPLHPRSRGIRRQRAPDFRRRGGAGGNSPRRLQRRRLPRPDVHHGHGPAPWQRCTKAALAAGNCDRRAAVAGIRRDRADKRQQHAGAPHHGGEEGQLALRRQRPEGLDVTGPSTPT